MKKFKINNAIIYADSLTTAIKIFKDSASISQTIDALIQDEEAAIDAYKVAISNLSSSLSTQDIKLLKHILNEEVEHVKELRSIKSNLKGD